MSATLPTRTGLGNQQRTSQQQRIYVFRPTDTSGAQAVLEALQAFDFEGAQGSFPLRILNVPSMEPDLVVRSTVGQVPLGTVLSLPVVRGVARLSEGELQEARSASQPVRLPSERFARTPDQLPPPSPQGVLGQVGDTASDITEQIAGRLPANQRTVQVVGSAAIGFISGLLVAKV